MGELLKNLETDHLNSICAAIRRTFGNGSCPVPMGQSQGSLRWYRYKWCKYWEIGAVTLEIKENAARADERRNIALTAASNSSAVPPPKPVKTAAPRPEHGYFSFAGNEPDVPEGPAFQIIVRRE